MPGDRCGWVNPVRSKTKQGARVARSPLFMRGPPGRSHEADGNVRPRWMAAAGRKAGTESGLQAGS